MLFLTHCRKTKSNGNDDFELGIVLVSDDLVHYRNPYTVVCHVQNREDLSKLEFEIDMKEVVCEYCVVIQEHLSLIFGFCLCFQLSNLFSQVF